ncbi:src kinase-associated phosphoprotein 2-like isoform X2 [Babylonia areolata]|uniref:src kinase-associated phosphoprotein 2-like isoform X2 n=1 Tax=Babylonia areolata TaxID=304850 RepID=UPI003FD03E7B
MSSLKQNIRSVLADVETFLVETLKSVKLNSSAKDHKDRLLEKIRLLLDEIPGSASSQQDSNASGGSLKISGGGDSGSGGNSSSNLQNMSEDDNAYADNLPKLAASDLKNKLQTGMLDKKKKSGFKSWEPLYCVVSGNTFYMYKKQGDSKQKEAFCLTGYGFSEAPGLEKDAAKKEMCFELTKPGAPTYQFRAGSKEGMVIWKEAITKGIQMAGTAADDGGEMYEDVGQEQESGANLPPPPPEVLEDVEDIYEECGENELPPPPSFKPPPPQPPPPAPESMDEVYDDCTSAVEEVKAMEKKADSPTPPPPLLPGRRREPPPTPSATPDPPAIPPPKADLPPIPSVPPPLPDRKATNEPPPVPSNPPPLPSRGGGGASNRVPQLRKPFMDRDEDFENIYYGKWDCAADCNKELTFKQGDLIHVLSRDFDAESWWVGELDGKVGLVPKEYLCPAFELVP